MVEPSFFLKGFPMLAHSFAEAEDFEEESLELIVGNHFIKTIKSYYADKRDKNDVLFF